MSIISKSDLVGKWQIPLTGFNDAVLTSIIDDVEKRYCIALLGADLYKDMLSNLTLDKYVALLDGGYYKSDVFSVDDNYVNVYFRGIKEMLKYFTYCEYMMATQQQIKPTGMVKPNSENSVSLSNADFSIAVQSMYKQATDITQEIIRFITEMNFDTDIISSTGVYATVPFVKYLEASNVVEINGVDYTVVGVNGDVIEFDKEVVGSTIKYILFRNFIHEHFKKMSAW